MNVLRRFALQGPLRRLVLHPRVRSFLSGVMALRFVPAAWQVTQPYRFLIAALAGSGLRDYRLRRSGNPVVVRHGEGSLEVMWEIFQRGCYAPPPDVAVRLPEKPRILDVGANVGVFSSFARDRWPDASILAIEADADNVAALFLLSTLSDDDRFAILQAAATTVDGPVPFLSGYGAGSRLADASIDTDDLVSNEVDGVDLLAMLGDADLIKLDIERGEWPILADPRMADGGPLVLVMEYHRRHVDDADALADATRLLRDAGFEVGHVAANVWGHGTLWAWRDA